MGLEMEVVFVIRDSQHLLHQLIIVQSVWMDIFFLVAHAFLVIRLVKLVVLTQITVSGFFLFIFSFLQIQSHKLKKQKNEISCKPGFILIPSNNTCSSGCPQKMYPDTTFGQCESNL